MKRISYVFTKIYDKENIKLAIKKASRGKRHHKCVQKILKNVDKHAEDISLMLQSKQYEPSPYIEKEIKDGSSQKVRLIQKPQFYPDQIIHWACILQLEDIFMRGMYYYNCGSVPNRGTRRPKNAIEKWLKTDARNTKYCLKIDINKFYASIPNNILKEKLRTIIKDEDCMWLLDTIIDSHQGMPIGNYTSPWLSNYYLQELDHFIKNELGVKYYVRYVDDLVLFGSNKKELHCAKREIDKQLKELGLSINDNWQVFLTDSRCVDFLGFKFHRNHTTLRRRNALRIMRRIKKIYKKTRLLCNDAAAVISYWGWVKMSDSYQFYKKYIDPYVKIGDCRKEVKYATKR